MDIAPILPEIVHAHKPWVHFHGLDVLCGRKAKLRLDEMRSSPPGGTICIQERGSKYCYGTNN